MIFFLIVFSVWYIIGVSGFIYWWTTEFDFTFDQVPLALTCGLAGPVAWTIGYDLHGDKANRLRKRS